MIASQMPHFSIRGVLESRRYRSTKVAITGSHHRAVTRSSGLSNAEDGLTHHARASWIISLQAEFTERLSCEEFSASAVKLRVILPLHMPPHDDASPERRGSRSLIKLSPL